MPPPHHWVTLSNPFCVPSRGQWPTILISFDTHSQVPVPESLQFYPENTCREQQLIHNATLLASTQLHILLKSQCFICLRLRFVVVVVVGFWLLVLFFWLKAMDSDCAMKVSPLNLGKHGS